MKKKYWWIVGIIAIILIISFFILLPILPLGDTYGHCLFDLQCQIIGWQTCVPDYSNIIGGSCETFGRPGTPPVNSRVESGGTPLSIEMIKFGFLTNSTGILNPEYDDVLGFIEIENEGDYNANKIILQLWATWKNITNSTEVKIGNITIHNCVNSSNSSTSDDTLTCIWKDVTYPSELKTLSFEFKNNSWNLPGGDNLNKCVDNEKNIVNCKSLGAIYEHGDQNVNFNINLTYDYVVNVSLPVRIIGFQLYLDRIQKGDIILQDLTSNYVGGPVKATLYSSKQPARADVPFLVVASIYNDGKGELLNINNFNITIYGGSVIDNVTFIGTDFRKNQPATGQLPDGCGDFIKDNNAKTFSITCSNTNGISIKPGEFKRVAFYVYPQNITNEQTVQIVGIANYEYKKTSTNTLTIARNPVS
jgi:hypothetical protein